ncbi:putative acyl-CoA dehydrogenase [Cupriavidus taiwanensis]|uniref:acyl-CoA dehydrogenase family protein n=1 Tax=Cupriavidus taiwanensis TaxID=164546 RepID=UPI000E1089FB|nr:acyl-CoA dehydrogenase family protein [Cupriavidus taiwanensis]SPA42266.1 putative acyl-CoA dehydrogenase [Cupriavidus taiwanensis]
METLSAADASAGAQADWIGLAATLGRTFDGRAPEIDASEQFVNANYDDLRAHRFFAAAVPQELGGAGLSHQELGAVLRELGKYCGSTALAFAMHTHPVATAAWRWRNQQAPVEGLLKRVGAEQLVLLGSGGSDWLQGSGKATRVDGGYRVDARKIFASGAPVADLFMTCAVYDDPEAGPTVLHFALPMKTPGVRVLSNWHTLGMRGTGSHDVMLEGVLVPDTAVAARRPQGVWHPMMHTVAMIALPLIYAVYVGIAEAARDIALQLARQRRLNAHAVEAAGRLCNEADAAQLALDAMFAAAAGHAPGAITTNRIMSARTLAARAVLATVEAAMDLAGGAGFYRDAGLERRFRDAQGARFHPLQAGAQQEYAGRMALGLEIDAPTGEVRTAAQ